ncbi:MAG: hypothetical protein HYS05_07085 [Acidobacteria bacterium]|nr:hypothetical protein [Acidobacteriota bacterium]
MATAREALGGEKRLSGVKSFVATGRTRQVRGENLVPIEFEISTELPDKYVRKDEIPAQESGPTSTGFNGDELIQDPPQQPPNLPPGGARLGAPPPPAGGRDGGSPPPTVPPAGGRQGEPPAGGREGGPPPNAAAPGGRVGGRASGPPMSPAEQQAMARRTRTATVKQDFVRLTLGMFASSFSSYPLTFTYAGMAEAPQGKADVLDVKGPASFALKLFINSQTHLPIMVSWQVQAQDRVVEHRVYYADYRDVDGIQFPFQLRRSVAGVTIEETVFDRFRINAKIDPRKFEVRK